MGRAVALSLLEGVRSDEAEGNKLFVVCRGGDATVVLTVTGRAA
jgi:hypothetical protein